MTGASKSPRQSTLPAPRGHPLPKEGGQSSVLRSFLVLPTIDANSGAISPGLPRGACDARPSAPRTPGA